jgi:hypothetical protein
MPPLLPRELIEQVLSDDQLSKADLAGVCLLSKDYSEFGRRRLYRDVEVMLIEEEDDDYSDCGFDYDRTPITFWFSSKSTANLLRTLKASSTLGRLVHNVAFIEIDCRSSTSARRSSVE